MQHPIYRNLTVKDTLFGLEIMDLVIMSLILNIVFSVNTSNAWSAKLLNCIIVILSYSFLSAIKSRFPKGYLNNMINFLFKPRRNLATWDDELMPFYEVIHDKK